MCCVTRWDRGPISDYFLVWIDLFSVELIVEMGVRRFMGVPLVSCGSRGRLLVALGHAYLLLGMFSDRNLIGFGKLVGHP